MEDIAPGLLENIQRRFSEWISLNPKIRALLKRISDGNATYADAEDYAYLVGEALSQAFGEFITPGSLPDGRMYYNIAQRVVRPMLEEDHGIVSDAAVLVQKALNEKAGIGIIPQTVPVNEDRVAGIVDKISNAQQFEDVSWVLDAPVKNFSMNVVDDTLRANVEFQGRSGLHPKVIRKAHGKRCPWCRSLEGEYDYPNVPQDVYRRHENCRCTVDYYPGDGRRQNVHTKQWTSREENDKIENRKRVNLLSVENRKYEPDIIIGRSTGAKAKNYEVMDLLTGEKYHFAEGSRIHNVEVFAGLGVKQEYRKAYKYSDKYGGLPAEWQHVKGHGILETPDGNRPAEIHWSQHKQYGKHDFFIKRWEDE